MLVGEVKAVEAIAFAARSTGVVMEATGAVVAVDRKLKVASLINYHRLQVVTVTNNPADGAGRELPIR